MRTQLSILLVVAGTLFAMGCGGSGAIHGIGQSFVVTPVQSTVTRGGSLTLTGEPVEYPGGYTIGWSVREGASGGTVVPSTDPGPPTATYTAPSTPGTYHVAASLTSPQGNRAATATIVVP